MQGGHNLNMTPAAAAGVTVPQPVSLQPALDWVGTLAGSAEPPPLPPEMGSDLHSLRNELFIAQLAWKILTLLHFNVTQVLFNC